MPEAADLIALGNAAIVAPTPRHAAFQLDAYRTR